MQYVNFESIILTEQFHEDFKNCAQILKKDKRPYVLVIIEIDGLLCAVPLRSNKLVDEYKIIRAVKLGIFFQTENKDECNKRGLDFAKLVILKDEHYIYSCTKLHDKIQKAYIHSSKQQIAKLLYKYIHNYKSKFMKLVAGNYHKDIYYFCATSSLQYFHDFLGLPESLDVINATANHLLEHKKITESGLIKI